MAVIPLLAMMFSVLGWSLFPLVSVWGIDRIGIYDYIFWTYVVGLVTSVLILAAQPRRARRTLPGLRQIDRKTFVEIFLGCLTVLLSFACLLKSFSFMSKPTATMIFESWPIMAMYITPLLIRKRWEKTRLRDLFAAISMAGLAFLMYPEKQDPFFSDTFNWKAISSLFLPLLGGAFMAVASVLKARVSATLGSKSHPLAALMKVQVFFSAGVTLLALLFSFLWPDKQSAYDAHNIMAVLFIGIVIHTLGNITYTLAVLKSRKSNIVVLWYLMPVFAVAWLWLAGKGDITPYIVLGSIFIVTSNLMLSVPAEKTNAYNAALIGLLGCGVYVYFSTGINMGDYYQALSVPVVLYAILVAFLMDRLIRSDRLEEDLAIEIINYIDRHAAHIGKDAAACTRHIMRLITASNPRVINMHYRALRNRKGTRLSPVYDQLDKLAVSKLRAASFSEMFVLFIVGLLTVVMASVYRPAGVIADGTAIVMSLTVIFIFFSMLDMAARRHVFDIEIRPDGTRSITRQATEDRRGEKFLSSILILLIMVAFIGLLWMKNGFHW